MKAGKLLLIPAALLLLAAGMCMYLFAGPYRFAQLALRQASLQQLQSSAAVSSPADAADEYLYGRFRPSDRPGRNELEIAVRYISGQEAVVTVIDRYCKDDSVSVTCDRLTLRCQDGAWIPIQHQAAWQGRGRMGWTTQPTS